MKLESVLIVEDDFIVAKVIEKNLVELGYVVAGLVATGEEAIVKAGSERPDLVLMDIQLLGDMDGIAASEKIHTAFNIPVIFLTALSDRYTFDRSLVTAPYGYIIKPFNQNTLSATILVALNKKRADESLREANKKLTLLSSITRHDINNQLTVQMGYLEILGDTPLDPSQNEYFGKVSTAAKRISAMVRFTREYEEIGVNAPVWQDTRTLVDAVAKEAPLGKVMVNNDLPAGTEVFADQLITRVFYNLMDNAARYGGKITAIRFSALERDGDEVLVCEDDGEGVPAEEKEKIFERGFGKNTGLGLALAREILSITGITISETGGPGNGARFEITVPKGVWRLHEVR
ncbi:MAG: response regulator [Methanomicrobiales archaeon]|nr:response regulator [Methanomicrobiales archaeon]